MPYYGTCFLRHAQPFKGPFVGTIWVGWYQKKHSPSHTHPDHQTSFINFFHLLRSIASSLFNIRAWQSFSTTCLQVLFGLPLGLGPSTSYISSRSHHFPFTAHAHITLWDNDCKPLTVNIQIWIVAVTNKKMLQPNSAVCQSLMASVCQSVGQNWSTAVWYLLIINSH